jgi:hypothetical protein
MAAVIRIKRRRDAPSESYIDFEPILEDKNSQHETPKNLEQPTTTVRFKRLCTSSLPAPLGANLPPQIEGAVRAVFEVRRTRKRLRLQQESSTTTTTTTTTTASGSNTIGSSSGDQSLAVKDDDDVIRATSSSSTSTAALLPSLGPVRMRVFDVVLDDHIEGQAHSASSLSSSSSITHKASLVRRWARPVESTAALLASTAAANAFEESAAKRPRNVPSHLLTSSAATAATRIMTPFERKMDEAIWHAFRIGNLELIFEAIDAGADVNYRRFSSDGTSCLMAVAFRGDDAAAAALMRRRSIAHLKDFEGRTAADYALLGSPPNIALHAILRDLAKCEIEEMEKQIQQERVYAAEIELLEMEARAERSHGDAKFAVLANAAKKKREENELLKQSTDDGFEYDIYVPVDSVTPTASSSSTSSSSSLETEATATATTSMRVALDLASFGSALAALEDVENEWDRLDFALDLGQSPDSDNDSEDIDGQEIDYGDEEDEDDENDDDDDEIDFGESSAYYRGGFDRRVHDRGTRSYHREDDDNDEETRYD